MMNFAMLSGNLRMGKRSFLMMPYFKKTGRTVKLRLYVLSRTTTELVVFHIDYTQPTMIYIKSKLFLERDSVFIKRETM